MRLAWLAAPAALVVFGVVFACISDDPGHGPVQAAPGDHLGPCFANGTCNAGLVCKQGVCLAPDEPVADGGLDAGGSPDGGDDGAALDAGDAGGSHDAGAPCKVAIAPAVTTIPCNTADGALCSPPSAHCCSTTGAQSTCAQSGCGASFPYDVACVGTSQCLTVSCCASLQILDATTCPPTVTFKQADCSSQADCVDPNLPEQTVKLCDEKRADCPGGKTCTAVKVINGTNSFEASACL
jgi:hypothetical protein